MVNRTITYKSHSSDLTLNTRPNTKRVPASSTLQLLVEVRLLSEMWYKQLQSLLCRWKDLPLGSKYLVWSPRQFPDHTLLVGLNKVKCWRVLQKTLFSGITHRGQLVPHHFSERHIHLYHFPCWDTGLLTSLLMWVEGFANKPPKHKQNLCVRIFSRKSFYNFCQI